MTGALPSGPVIGARAVLAHTQAKLAAHQPEHVGEAAALGSRWKAAGSVRVAASTRPGSVVAWVGVAVEGS